MWRRSFVLWLWLGLQVVALFVFDIPGLSIAVGATYGVNPGIVLYGYFGIGLISMIVISSLFKGGGEEEKENES